MLVASLVLLLLNSSCLECCLIRLFLFFRLDVLFDLAASSWTVISSSSIAAGLIVGVAARSFMTDEDEWRNCWSLRDRHESLLTRVSSPEGVGEGVEADWDVPAGTCSRFVSLGWLLGATRGDGGGEIAPPSSDEHAAEDDSDSDSRSMSRSKLHL